jgi:hypothetical protein
MKKQIKKEAEIKKTAEAELEQLVAQAGNNPTDQQLQSLAEFIFGKGVQLV